jgi:hypothetical protein
LVRGGPHLRLRSRGGREAGAGGSARARRHPGPLDKVQRVGHRRGDPPLGARHHLALGQGRGLQAHVREAVRGPVRAPRVQGRSREEPLARLEVVQQPALLGARLPGSPDQGGQALLVPRRHRPRLLPLGPLSGGVHQRGPPPRPGGAPPPRSPGPTAGGTSSPVTPACKRSPPRVPARRRRRTPPPPRGGGGLP